MNHLIAKLKNTGDESIYKKILSESEIYRLPDETSQFIEFNPDCKIDEDEWFGIKNFSDKIYCIDFLKKEFNSIEYDPLGRQEVDHVDYICSYQNRNEYHFQRLFKKQRINRKFITIGDKFQITEQQLIIINEHADAIYLKSWDTLLFKSFNKIVGIFNGIDELYRQADDAEIETFLKQDFIHLDDKFSVDKVKKMNRRRIAIAIDTLKGFKIKEKKAIMNYIKEYCPKLETQDDSFVIRSDEELKLLLYGIEQRYYTTPVTNERRLANSVINIQ
jgi:hypothetical protein